MRAKNDSIGHRRDFEHILGYPDGRVLEVRTITVTPDAIGVHAGVSVRLPCLRRLHGLVASL